jgi:hypothetical protein
MPAAASSAIGYRGNSERRRGYRETAPVALRARHVANRLPSNVGQTWGIRVTAAVSRDAGQGATIRNCTVVGSISTVVSAAAEVRAATVQNAATEVNAAATFQDPVGSCTTALVVQEPFVPVTG